MTWPEARTSRWSYRPIPRPKVSNNVGMEPNSDQTRDLAYYYADWIWPPASSDWMKSLLLFFDGLALALSPDLLTKLSTKIPSWRNP